MSANLAAGVQYVGQVLVALTVASVVGVQQDTAEKVEVLVQKVVVVQHSVGVYCVKVWQTVGYLEQFAVGCVIIDRGTLKMI